MKSKSMRAVRILAMSLALVMTLGLSACGSSESKAPADTQAPEAPETSNAVPAEETAKKIAILPYAMAQEFGADFVAAAQEAGEAAGFEIQVLDPNYDLQTEVSMLEDLIVQGVDGIIFSAIDSTSMGAVVEEVKAAGIKIIDYDCVVDEGNTDASIKSNDTEGGRAAAQIMMERLNDPNATVIVYGTASTIGTGYARISGFKSYIEENYPNVTIVETRPSEGAGTRDGCRAWAVDMVTAYPEASAFFTFFGDGAIGTYYGLQEAGRDDIIIVGYDATAEQQQIMANDGVNCILTASIAQYPDEMGRRAIETMTKLFDGTYTRNGVDDVIFVEPGIYYADTSLN